MEFNVTTFVFELVNFVALVWLLRLIAYKPLQRAIARRREAIASAEAAARAALEEAEAREAEVVARVRELDGMAVEARRKAGEEAAAERARILELAREDAEAERARARRMMESERRAAEAWVREVALNQGTAVAGRLLTELAPEAVQHALTARMLEAIASHAEALRAEAAGREPEVEIVVPAKAPAEDLDALRAALNDAVGTTVAARGDFVVREDDDIVGGLVVRVGAQVLDGSIAGQLEAFRDHARRILAETGEARRG